MVPRQGRKRRGLIYWLKIGLPATAIILTIVVIVWSRLELKETRINMQDLGGQEPKPAESQPVQQGLSVKNVTYDGFDKSGRPYHVIAADARAEGKNYRLTRPEADLNLGEDKWAALKADSGYYHAADQIVDFSGNVVLYRSDGMVFETEEAHLDIAAGTITGDKPVKGQGDQLDIQSQGFQILEDGGLIVFSGKAHAVIVGKKESEGEQSP